MAWLGELHFKLESDGNTYLLALLFPKHVDTGYFKCYCFSNEMRYGLKATLTKNVRATMEFHSPPPLPCTFKCIPRAPRQRGTELNSLPRGQKRHRRRLRSNDDSFLPRPNLPRPAGGRSKKLRNLETKSTQPSGGAADGPAALIALDMGQS